MRVLELAVGALFVASCSGPREDRPEPEDVRVGEPAPLARGRFLCAQDSLRSTTASNYISCDAGAGVRFHTRNDTVVSISRITRREIPDSLSVFDFWKSTLEAEWTRRVGSLPTDITQSQVPGFSYFRAHWALPDGTTHTVTIGRGLSDTAEIKWATLRCGDRGNLEGTVLCR